MCENHNKRKNKHEKKIQIGSYKIERKFLLQIVASFLSQLWI